MRESTKCKIKDNKKKQQPKPPEREAQNAGCNASIFRALYKHKSKIYTSTSASTRTLYKHKSRKLKLKLAFTGTQNILWNDQKQFNQETKTNGQESQWKKNNWTSRKIHISLSDPYPATWLASAISKNLFIHKISKIKWWSFIQNKVQIRIVHLKYDQGTLSQKILTLSTDYLEVKGHNILYLWWSFLYFQKDKRSIALIHLYRSIKQC